MNQDLLAKGKAPERITRAAATGLTDFGGIDTMDTNAHRFAAVRRPDVNCIAVNHIDDLAGPDLLQRRGGPCRHTTCRQQGQGHDERSPGLE